MPLTIAQGDIFRSEMPVLACPVNVVGVMGAGLARQVASRFPDVVAPYQELCASGELRVGHLAVVCVPGRRILMFPTKEHWKNPSKMRYVEEGLDDLCARFGHLGVTGLALPLLGAGLGGLPRDQVRGLIERKLKKIPIVVELYV